MVTRTAGRTTAGLAIVAAMVALVGNGIAPRFNGDDVDVYRKIAGSQRFAVAEVIVLVALALVTAAFAGLARKDDNVESALTHYYARLAITVGGSIALAQAGLQLYGYRQEAKAFVAANPHNVVSAFWATNALDHLSSALFAIGTIVLLGIAPVLLGWAQVRSRFAGRLGVAAIVGGAVCIVVGFGELLKADQSTFDIPFAVGSVVVTLWLLATGVALWREPGASAVDVTKGRSTGAATHASA